MLDNIKLNKVIFIDIETVSQESEYKKLSKKWKDLWEKKSTYLRGEEEAAADVYNKAGIYAEFGKVICISVGIYREFADNKIFRIKSFFGKNEKQVLTQFCDMFKKNFQSTDFILCAHNGKEFDFPFLARRILINNLSLPFVLDIAGRKPWEVQHLDTLQLWKFGDYKHYTSLALLCELFKIKSPKNEMEGSDVGRVFWEDDDLERIVKYCQNDTLAVAQLILAYKGMKQLKDSEVEIIS